MARPQKDISGATVRRLAEIMCTKEEIAAVVGCSVDTLERRFADVIRKGMLVARTSLRRKQFGLALGGNVTMLIWLGKQFLAQEDKPDWEPVGEGGEAESESGALTIERADGAKSEWPTN